MQNGQENKQFQNIKNSENNLPIKYFVGISMLKHHWYKHFKQSAKMLLRIIKINITLENLEKTCVSPTQYHLAVLWRDSYDHKQIISLRS